MLKQLVVSLGIFLLCISIANSYAQTTSSKWEINKKLGEIAIRMSPKTAMYISDQSARMGEPAMSLTLKTDLAGFESLLKQGADPSAIRIADFEAAGKKDMGSGMTLMSTGKPGRVVPASESGLTLFQYLKANGLDEASRLLIAYGLVSKTDIENSFDKNDVETFKDELRAASVNLRNKNPSLMLKLVPDDVAKILKPELDSYLELKVKIDRLLKNASAKAIKLPSYFGVALAEHIFETIHVNSSFESDGNSVWVSTPTGKLNFIKTGNHWVPRGYSDVDSMSKVSKVVQHMNSRGVVVDALSDSIEKGETTNDNVIKKIGEFTDKFLVRMN